MCYPKVVFKMGGRKASFTAAHLVGSRCRRSRRWWICSCHIFVLATLNCYRIFFGMNISSKNKRTQFTWTAGKRIISFLLRNKMHSWRASYNRESPMDLTWNVSEHAVLHVLLLSSFPFPLSGLLFALTFSLAGYVVWSCSLVHYMIPTELHTVFWVFFMQHPRQKKRQSMQHSNTFATCQWGLCSELVRAFYSQLFPFIRT